jgi:hypothetical protein
MKKNILVFIIVLFSNVLLAQYGTTRLSNHPVHKKNQLNYPR